MKVTQETTKGYKVYGYGLLLIACFAILFVAKTTEANYFTLPASPTSTITSYFDHDVPDYTDNSYFVRYDGMVWDDGSASPGSCTQGINCYDGHNGIDFAGDYGDNISASYDGEVKSVYWNNLGGWTMHIWHKDIQLSTLYAHLATTTVATTSDIVSRFDHIAEMDSTGASSTGAHLHFGVVDDEELTGNRIDPFGWWATTTDPWPHNQGYLWTTDPPSFDLAKTVEQDITSDTTWRGNYIIDGTLTISSGATLTLAPGTVVKFDGTSSKLSVNGNRAKGVMDSST